MESKTYIKNLRISPKKLRFLLPEIKKLRPSDALVQLLYSQNRPGKIFYSSVKSAITNAVNFLKVDEKVLIFKHLSVEEGQKLKRFRAGGRGTAKPILKRFSHIKLVLGAEEPRVDQILNSKSETKIKPKTLKSKTKISKVLSTKK